VIRGLIFDFDGLIVDTESTIFQSWQELYREYGQELPMKEWGQIIGTSADEHFDPLERLEAQLGRKFENPEELKDRRLQRELELVAKQPVLPGVRAYIEDAQRLSLKLAVASSSPLEWVGLHLKNIGLIDEFDVIHTSDDVERTKPDPALFQLALTSLALDSDEAIVLEDSPNGVTAAQRAGIFCVAVPNPLTKLLPLGHADMRLNSLSEMHLKSLIDHVESFKNRHR